MPECREFGNQHINFDGYSSHGCRARRVDEDWRRMGLRFYQYERAESYVSRPTSMDVHMKDIVRRVLFFDLLYADRMYYSNPSVDMI